MKLIKSKVKKLCLALLMGATLLLTTLSFLGHIGRAAQASEPNLPLPGTPYYYPPSAYGTLYIYNANSPGLWAEGYRTDMRLVLQQAQSLSLTTIVQGFPYALADESRENDWLIFLDEAKVVGIKVVAHLVLGGENEEPCLYNQMTQQFDCSALKHFLDVVSGHPALIGYVGSHEPLQEFESSQLRTLYAEMKAYAPGLLLANYMSDMYWFEQRPDLFPGRDFSDGICDICMIWYYPFRTVDSQPVFETTQVEDLLENNLPLVRENDSDAQVWFLAQSFAYTDHPRNLRMPMPAEMAALYQLVMQYPVDGFLWYAWQHGTYDANLGDPEMADQHDELDVIAENFLMEADLALQQTLLTRLTTILPNDVLTYVLTFANNGPQKASGVVIENIVPPIFQEPLMVGSSGVAITQTSGTTFSWDVGSLDTNQGGRLTVTVRVNPDLQTRVSITNLAVISTTAIDKNLGDNRANLNLVIGYYNVYMPLIVVHK